MCRWFTYGLSMVYCMIYPGLRHDFHGFPWLHGCFFEAEELGEAQSYRTMEAMKEKAANANASGKMWA